MPIKAPKKLIEKVARIRAVTWIPVNKILSSENYMETHEV